MGDKKITAHRIRELLKEKGLTQLELSQKTGITTAAISQIVNADRFPSTPVLMKIAKVLTVSIDYLVGQSDSKDIEEAIKNDTDLQQFFRNYQDLDPQTQEVIRSQVEFWKSKKKHGSGK